MSFRRLYILVAHTSSIREYQESEIGSSPGKTGVPCMELGLQGKGIQQ